MIRLKKSEDTTTTNEKIFMITISSN